MIESNVFAQSLKKDSMETPKNKNKKSHVEPEDEFIPRSDNSQSSGSV